MSVQRQPFDEPILVTGTGRSGTTLVTRILERCGAWLGPSADTEVAENTRIKRAAVYELLEIHGYDRFGIDPLPDKPVMEESLYEAVDVAVKAEGWDGERWLFKDAKILLAWPSWLVAFPYAQWVVPWRPFEQVVKSYIEFVNKPEAIVRKAFEFYAEQVARLSGATALGDNLRMVESQRIIDGDLEEIREVVEWLGLEWTDEALELVEPKRWHDR